MSFEPRETHEQHQRERELQRREGRQTLLILGSIAAVVAVIGIIAYVGLRQTETDEPAATITPDAAPPADVIGFPQSLVARNTNFNRDLITARTQDVLIIQFTNDDEGMLHNFSVYVDEKFADLYFQGEPIMGEDEIDYEITFTEAGTYFFRCDFHPGIMTGELVVR